MRKELGSSVRKWQGGGWDLVVGLMPAEGPRVLAAPFRKKRKKNVDRDKNNIFKEYPQNSSGLLMAVLCKYFCA